MRQKLADGVRDAGYEALFLLGGFLALSTHPTIRNADRISRWIDESQSRRQSLRRLERRGLIETGEERTKWVPRLTGLGHAVFAGGRHPEEAWGRGWDGSWRLLTFDLPRDAAPSRLKFWRWLRANHFGHLQGSVWITPDPVPAIEKVLAKYQLDPSMVLVFAGGIAGKKRPPDLAAMAWDFPSVNAAYRRYGDAASRLLGQTGRKAPPPGRLRDIIQRDRELWWAAVRHDPLLPRPLHPKGYQGPDAWRIRRKLLAKLARAFDRGALS